MGKTFNFKPKSGDYFTWEDVSPPVLPAPPPKKKNADLKDIFNKPPIPMSKHRETLWQRQISRLAAGNGSPFAPPPTISAPRAKSTVYPGLQNIQKPPPSNEKSNDDSDKDDKAGGGSVALPPYLRFFLCPNLKRSAGNPALVWTIKVTTEKDGKVAWKYQEFHMIVCWYQFIIGALGNYYPTGKTQSQGNSESILKCSISKF